MNKDRKAVKKMKENIANQTTILSVVSTDNSVEKEKEETPVVHMVVPQKPQHKEVNTGSGWWPLMAPYRSLRKEPLEKW